MRFFLSYTLIILLIHGFKIIDFTTFLQLYILGFILKFLILFFIQVLKGNLYINLSLNILKIREIIVYGLYVFVGGASIMLVTRLDMLMIGSMLNLKEVAYYTLAFYIGSAIKVPGRSIVSISMPFLAKAWENQDFKQIQMIYEKSSINQFIVGGLFFLCIWINIDVIFSVIPDKFSEGKWVVFYIALAQIFNGLTGVNGAIIINSKYYKYELITNIFLVFITLITNYFFIKIYGIEGAAIATAISIFLFNFIRIILIKVKMGLQPFTIKTLITFLILVLIYNIIIYLPLSGNMYIDVIWKMFIVFLFFIPLLFTLELSEDINKIIIDF